MRRSLIESISLSAGHLDLQDLKLCLKCPENTLHRSDTDVFQKSTKVVQHGNNPTIRSPTVLLTTQATTDHLHVPHRTEYLPRNEHLSVFGASKPVLRTLWLQSNRIS